MQTTFAVIGLLLLLGCGRETSDPSAAASPTPHSASQAGFSIEQVADEARWNLRITDTDGVALSVGLVEHELFDTVRTAFRGGDAWGLLLGPRDPKFATVDQLRQMGRAPASTLHTLDVHSPDATWSDFENISVINVLNGEWVIGRWEEGLIVDIWYVGPLVHLLREQPRDVPHCQILQDMCCRMIADPSDPEAILPNPIAAACMAGILLCEDVTIRDSMCGCITQACFEIDINLPDHLSLPGAASCVMWFPLCSESESRGNEPAQRGFTGTDRFAYDAAAAIIERWMAGGD